MCRPGDAETIVRGIEAGMVRLSAARLQCRVQCVYRYRSIGQHIWPVPRIFRQSLVKRLFFQICPIVSIFCLPIANACTCMWRNLDTLILKTF